MISPMVTARDVGEDFTVQILQGLMKGAFNVRLISSVTAVIHTVNILIEVRNISSSNLYSGLPELFI